ncbi:cystatin-B-like [Engystomops pustulosus]|uniref:cystatin-B-like n=1 Tax=Engystomops pustulosus TaxID=76066 RepID=UPI003AFABD0D
MAASHIALLFLVSIIAEHRTYGNVEKRNVNGELSPVQTADQHVQDLCDQVKHLFVEKSKLNPTMFKAISFREQIADGAYHFVKVDLGGGQFAHLRIFEPLPIPGETLNLDGFRLLKTSNDPIEYFS